MNTSKQENKTWARVIACLVLDDHVCAIARHNVFYNFARFHQSLRVTPIMEAGIADHVWTLKEIIGLIKKGNRGATRCHGLNIRQERLGSER